MKVFKLAISLAFIFLFLSALFISGCGGDSTCTCPNTVVNPTLPPFPEWPSWDPNSGGDDDEDTSSALVGYVIARNDLDNPENGLAMIDVDAEPDISNYSPVNSATVSLSDNPFVEAETDMSGRFILTDVPYSQVEKITTVTVTGDTDNLQSSALYVPIQIEVIVNPVTSAVNASEARIIPSAATVYAGEVRQFKVYVIDNLSQLINPESFSWTVDGDIGVINNNGIFQAGLNPGTGNVRVVVGSLEASAPVEVVDATSPGSVTGQVTYSEGSNAEGMDVLVEGLSYVSTTESNGLYALNNIPPGDRTVIVRDNGVEVWRGSITVNDGEAASLNIKLIPAISSLTPNTGKTWGDIVIKGYSFAVSQGTSNVTFNGADGRITGTVKSWSNNSITVSVPPGVADGQVIVNVGGEDSNGVFFNAIWETLSSGMGAEQLNGVHFISSSEGWIVSSGTGNGKIYHTADTGQTWSLQDSSMVGGLYDICFVDSSKGWAAGDDGILYTEDGGSSWSSQISGVTFQSIYFVNENRGWAPSGRYCYLTTNGGGTWTPVDVDNQLNNFMDVYFYDESNGWVVGNYSGGVIYRTADGGNSWSNQVLAVGGAIMGVYFNSLTDGWAVGNSGTFFSTSNGGSDWSYTSNYPSVDILDVHFTSSNNGWIAGRTNLNQNRYWAGIRHTTDSGSNWTDETASTQFIRDLYFLDSNNGWAVGDNGTLLKYSP